VYTQSSMICVVNTSNGGVTRALTTDRPNQWPLSAALSDFRNQWTPRGRSPFIGLWNVGHSDVTRDADHFHRSIRR
jgi:hypothetical protein